MKPIAMFILGWRLTEVAVPWKSVPEFEEWKKEYGAANELRLMHVRDELFAVLDVQMVSEKGEIKKLPFQNAYMYQIEDCWRAFYKSGIHTSSVPQEFLTLW